VSVLGVIIMNVVMISVYCYAEYVYVVCHYSECCAECRGSGTILAGKARSLPLEWSPVRFFSLAGFYDTAAITAVKKVL
jgi:hypothetical protein